MSFLPARSRLCSDNLRVQFQKWLLTSCLPSSKSPYLLSLGSPMIKAYLGNTVGSVSDHHNKVSHNMFACLRFVKKKNNNKQHLGNTIQQSAIRRGMPLITPASCRSNRYLSPLSRGYLLQPSVPSVLSILLSYMGWVFGSARHITVSSTSTGWRRG